MHTIKSYIKHVFRNGKLFQSCFKEIEAEEKYSTAELESYQNEKLRILIKIAYENVPFYSKIFKEHKLTPADIKTSADLYKLPIIDKTIVRNNSADFLNKNFNGLKFRGYTSGTSGSPGVFWRDCKSINFENAVITLQQKWAGIATGDRRIWLRGDYIMPMEQQSPPFWKFDRFENQLVMSNYHLSEKTLPYFIKKIKEFSPKLLQAYPTSAYFIAKHLERIDEYINIPVVQTSSEIMFSEWRDLIEKRLNAKVFDYYGMAERVAIGIECRMHQGLHLVPSYGITEVNEGVLVGTALNNYVMPLIRYRTDDLVQFYKENCPCGGKFPRVYSIESRFEDIILSKDGRLISPVLSAFVFHNVKSVVLAQIIQKEDDGFIVKIVKTREYSHKDAQLILTRMQLIIGRGLTVALEYVDHIPMGKNGKFQVLISEKNRVLRKNV